MSAVQPASHTPPHFRAAGLMLASTMAFALMAITIRYASATMATTEIAFFRNFFGLLALLPLVLRPGRARPRPHNKTPHHKGHRVGAAGMMCG